MAKKKRANPEINSSSMADIAFLLLIFFLVTTTIANDRGILMQLPPKPDDIEDIDVKIKEHNLFKVYVNSADRLLVEGEPLKDIELIRDMVKEHVLNNGVNPEMSDSPKDAIVSFKTDRGTSYEMYIGVLNELQGAYYEMYGERVGKTATEWRTLTNELDDPENKKLYDKGRGKDKDGKVTFPMNISIAEPSKIGGN
ncbi:MAG: biopolymer transporter ExbD [Cyclobacteriaceae bacterium]|nr:biopolymer transporter ExbD [Cyclobacteriaceae bacterium]